MTQSDVAKRSCHACALSTAFLWHICLPKQCAEAFEGIRRAEEEVCGVQLRRCLLGLLTRILIRVIVSPKYRRCRQVLYFGKGRGCASAVQMRGMAVLTKVHDHPSVWRISMTCRVKKSASLDGIMIVSVAGKDSSTESLFMRELKRRGLSSDKAGKLLECTDCVLYSV